MSLEVFVGALQRAGCETRVEDLLDTLWLATRGRRLSLYAASPAKQPFAVSGGDREGKATDPGQAASDSASEHTNARQQPGERKSEPTPVYPAGRSAPEPKTVKASAVALPAGYPLPGRLQLARALRPFSQRWPSRNAKEIDEQRTVEASAENDGVLSPVFRPQRERWFDAHVVLEHDPAITLWVDMLRGFCRMLEDTGAFRSVQSWRLHIPARRNRMPREKRFRAFLQAPTGFRAPSQLLAGHGARRLIFYVTHGGSSGWLDGSYARAIAPWLLTASVVILHLRDQSCWQQGTLGEAHGLCHVREPGAATANLDIEVPWWSLPADPTGLLPVPAASLTPAGVSEWALMQMGRGRSSALFLLDPNPIRDEAPETPAAPVDFELAVELLKQDSPAAFRLAVYLSASAFTISVARVVQEAQFGTAADQSQLAEVLLSGLVFARSPEGTDADWRETYFDFYAEARSLLLRSLRESDAQTIGEALQERVSRYLERITGRAISFRALVPDPNGKYELPEWAQPFARFGLAVLRPAADAKTPVQRLEEFLVTAAGAQLSRIAPYLAALPPGSPLQPGSLEPSLWQSLRDAGLIMQDGRGQWHFLPGIEPLLARQLDARVPDRPTPFHDRFRDSSGDGPEMIWLPGGSFMMGDDKSDEKHEKPAHQVTLDHYAVGKYPVTLGEFRRFVAETGYKTEAEEGDGAYVWSERLEKTKDASWRKPYFDQDDSHPVVAISWNDARAYCEWLSKETGQAYGLLTEAQWEHACRAGSETAYCFGDDEKELGRYAWYGENWGKGSTHPVGKKEPNRWGLHDMHGNVWEWANDWYAEDYYEQLTNATRSGATGTANGSQQTPSDSEQTTSGFGKSASDSQQSASRNPGGPESGSSRVFRGGSWDVGADYCRSACRDDGHPGYRDNILGFRLSSTCHSPDGPRSWTPSLRIRCVQPHRSCSGIGRTKQHRPPASGSASEGRRGLFSQGRPGDPPIAHEARTALSVSRF